MVKVKCPSCEYRWIVRPDFDWKACVKCDVPLPSNAMATCVLTSDGEHEKKRMQQRFMRLDRSGDGTLDFDEMSSLLRKGNPHFSDIELWSLYKEIDKNLDGRITFDEFYDYLNCPHKGSNRSGKCTKNAGAPHEWKFGKCVWCGLAEGDQDVPRRRDSITTKNACSDGGKCQFKFSKCTKCGRSEIAVS
mmetsp:Transcript_76485/g.151339  ORF Transcript_76485/g.151339 Transcript_76485/m.151339 type:complete len:190 (+) Transcript_76485:83-652(+)